MERDDRQIRTPETQRLIGYRAINKSGEKGLALMKNQDECLGFICEEDLHVALNSGPYLEIT